MNGHQKHDDVRGMVIGGLITLGIGVLFLLHNLDIIPDFHIVWPVIPIIVGIAMILGAIFKSRGQGGA